jgi:aspartate aminotransferase
MVQGMRGSVILKIAGEVRAMIASGRPVCNLTVGDFDPKQFPIPELLLQAIHRALDAGETNYPPSDGMPALRKAITEYVAREQGVQYPVDSVHVTCGGRPVVYAAYRCVLNPGDQVLYSVPSWNNDHYSHLSQAHPVEIVASRASGFQPTLEQLAPHLSTARLLCLCTPGNPTGTVMDPATLKTIVEAVIEENEARARDGKRRLFILFDQMYGALVSPPSEHAHPLRLVPEAAPYLITLDGISKAFAATGLRLGWVMAAPAVISRIKDFLGHVGTWAPRPEQVATAEFLSDAAAVAAFRRQMDAELRKRLTALYQGFAALKQAGYPVDCIDPQGAIYLSLRLNLTGRSIGGKPIKDNEAIRQLLLEQAGLAVVPFQAFGLPDESGWFRMSVGAVSMADIAAAFPRVKAMLNQIE